MSQSVSPWIAFSLLLSASAASMASTITIDTPTSAAPYGSYYDAPTVGSTAVFAVGVYEHSERLAVPSCTQRMTS